MVTTPAPDDDVEKILTGIMAKQSPLMKQARTQGIQSAQQAGLGQSTAGIRAAQAAAYNVAMPIASQQAQQGHQKNTQTAQFGHETGMQQAGFQHATTQADLDRVHQTNMEQLNAYNQRLNMEAEGFQQRTTLDWQQRFEANQKNLDRQMQERLASMDINAANKERAVAAMSQFNQSHAAAYAQIAQNHELPPEARNAMLNHIDLLRQHNQNLVSSTFRYDIPW